MSGKSALAEFFQVNYCRLTGYVRSRLQDSSHTSGEDIVQDVMLRMLESPDLLARVVDLSAYVFQSLRNRVIDVYRRAEEDVVSLDSEDDGGLCLFDVLPAEGLHPEESYSRKARMELVFSLIRELPEDQARVIVETEFGGRRFRELSEEWGVPVGTLLARKHRGLAAIRRRLQIMKEV